MRARMLLCGLIALSWSACSPTGGGSEPAVSVAGTSFQGGTVLSETVQADGTVLRKRLVDVGGRWPKVQVDETVSGGTVVRQVAMFADHIIVKPRAGADADAIARRNGGRVIERLYSRHGLVLIETTGDPSDASRAYAADADVEYAEPDFAYETQVVPNDPSYGSLWGMTNINAPTAWDTQTGSATILVGVIDTGTDYNHADLSANIYVNPGEVPTDGIDNDGNGLIDDWHGWDFGAGDNNPMDSAQHGTHVSGTIGAVGNNSVGVVGVCWTVKIVPLKIATSGSTLSSSAAVSAVTYATTIGCKLTSNSWGGGGYSTSLYNAINDANTAGRLFVAAAGNSNVNTDSTIFYPAGYNLSNIIAVGSITSTNAKSSFSNYGALSVDLFAPGSSITSTVPGNGYSSLSGTSMACPHVAGACALTWSQFPASTHSWIKSRIMNTTTYTAAVNNLCVSDGRLNLAGAINGVPPVLTVTSPANGVTVAAQPQTFNGTATDGDGTVVSVDWQNTTTGGTGSAAGTNPWSASIPLAFGLNTVVFTATDDEAKTATVTRTITYNPPPTIALGTASLAYSVVTGAGDPAPQTFTVANPGGQTMNWTAVSDQPWLTLSPSSGSLTHDQSTTVTATVSVGTLPIGTHTATISVTAPGATNTPQTIGVTLDITDVPPPPPPGGGGRKGGKCGSIGLDLMLPLLVIWLLRRRREDATVRA